MPTTQLAPGGFPGARYGTFTKTEQVDPVRFLYLDANTGWITRSQMRNMVLVDGVSVPDAISGYVVLYVDSADGKIKAKDADGNITILGGTGSTETTYSCTASENLSAGDLVNIWSDSGTVSARKADASAGKVYAADGYVLATVTSGNSATVYSTGINNQLSGLTPGWRLYVATTAGSVTNSTPTGTGVLVQEVGIAISATSMTFDPKFTIILS